MVEIIVSLAVGLVWPFVRPSFPYAEGRPVMQASCPGLVVNGRNWDLLKPISFRIASSSAVSGGIWSIRAAFAT